MAAVTDGFNTVIEKTRTHYYPEIVAIHYLSGVIEYFELVDFEAYIEPLIDGDPDSRWVYNTNTVFQQERT